MSNSHFSNKSIETVPYFALIALLVSVTINTHLIIYFVINLPNDLFYYKNS